MRKRKTSFGRSLILPLVAFAIVFIGLAGINLANVMNASAMNISEVFASIDTLSDGIITGSTIGVAVVTSVAVLLLQKTKPQFLPTMAVSLGRYKR